MRLHACGERQVYDHDQNCHLSLKHTLLLQQARVSLQTSKELMRIRRRSNVSGQRLCCYFWSLATVDDVTPRHAAFPHFNDNLARKIFREQLDVSFNPLRYFHCRPPFSPCPCAWCSIIENSLRLSVREIQRGSRLLSPPVSTLVNERPGAFRNRALVCLGISPRVHWHG